MPITKYSYIVKDVTKLAETIRKAFRIAKTGRPGPVLIDIPKDVTAKVTEYEKEYPGVYDREVIHSEEEDLKKAVEMIKEAQRPYIFVGGGAVLSEASKELYEFAQKVDAPVTDSLMGKGAFPGTDPLYTGMLGMHGTKASNFGVSQCDLLITIGARFSDRVTGNTKTFASNAKIIHIDVDAAEINKNIQVDYRLSNTVCKALYDAEIECERALLQPRKDMYCIYEQAVKSGKRIIAISDIHLPSAILKEILSAKGFSNISEIYVSCEQESIKNDGSLYDVVLSCEKVPADIQSSGYRSHRL